MNYNNMNETQIRYTFDSMKAENEVIEVRVVGQRTYSGYFKNIDNLIRAIKPHGNSNIYFVLNEVADACYDRAQQEKIEMAKNTTSDNDISARRWILIDIDAKRPSGVSATDEEKEHSRQVGREVYQFLRNVGFLEPVIADSGNGMHLLYKISLANNPDNTALIKDFLNVLSLFFSNDKAEIDTSVYNASRITKLYGTSAVKGSNSTERPHRESRILKAPATINHTDISLIKKVVDMSPQQEKKSYENRYGQDSFDLDGFISKHGIKIRQTVNEGGVAKHILDHCCFDESHKGKDAALFQLANGAVAYHCFHNSCSNKKWQDVRQMFEPNAYSTRHAPSFHTRPPTTPKIVKSQEDDDRGGKFLQMHEIKRIDRSELVYMPTHFQEMDKKMIGFLQGEVTIWSGVNSSGKSTVLGQVGLNNVNDGFNVLMYSGELIPSRVKSWLHLQSAGRQFTMPTEYENYFYVPEKTGNKIDEWMKGKFYLYNNDYGNEYGQLLADLENEIVESEIDVIILDNIMTLDLDGLDNNENEKQKKAVLSLTSLAKKYGVHIHIVAHPRKTVRLLRKEDISGSGNMPNLVDNVIIIHRVNNDFNRYASEYFGEDVSSHFEKYSNMMEVCKNRDLGIQDFMCGLYFEVESKRFLNEPFENLVFGWQDIDTSQLEKSEIVTALEVQDRDDVSGYKENVIAEKPKFIAELLAKEEVVELPFMPD